MEEKTLPQDRPLRILLGTEEIAGQLYDLGSGLRFLGHQTTTIVETLNPFFPDLPYDRIVRPSVPKALSDPRRVTVRAMRKLFLGSHGIWVKGRYLPPLRDFDLYIFQFGASLLPGNRDYPLIKRGGRKLVCIFVGSDIRHWSAAFPARSMHRLGSYTEFRDSWLSLEDNLGTLRMAERYADALLFQPSYGELALRPYNHFFIPIDLARYDFNIPDRDVPVLVHAPSRRAVKGTDEIVACVERLRKQGLAFEFRLLENMPNKEILTELSYADVVVDEINDAHYGRLALEAMASGCAVAGGNRSDVVPYPEDPPVLHLSPKNLKEQLTRLITNRGLRVQLSERGRSFVETNYSHTRVADRLLGLVRGELPADYYPSFFAHHYRLPEGERLSNRVRRLTSDVIKTSGLPRGVEPQDLVARGLMEDLGSEARFVPRWNGNA